MHLRASGMGRIGTVASLVSLLLWFSVSPDLAAAPVREGRVVLESPLQVADIQVDELVTRLALDRTAYRDVRPADDVVLTNFALGRDRRVDLELHRVEVFADNARIVLGTPDGDVPLPRPDVTLFSGQVADQPGSLVFLSLSPHGNHGLIRLDDETFVVSSGRELNEADAVVYDLNALPPGAIKWRDWTCSIDELPALENARILPAGVDQRASGSTAETPVTWRRVELAIETDWEFTGWLFGGDTGASGAYAATLIGAISEIYARDINAELAITYLRLWPNSSDPWNQSNTIDQLYQFRDYWNAYMTDVERHLAHYISGRGLGGGVAYLDAICSTWWDYGLSANIGGYFPYPLQDNHGQNWDVMVVAHELGHNFGGPHTHSMFPPIDNCAGGDCSVTPNATIMSYCHQCPGGMTNIQLRFHDRIVNEQILPFLGSVSNCDLSGEPPNCPGAARPSPDVLGATNRHLSIVGGNPGQQVAIRVVVTSLPAPYDVLNDQTMWVGEPRQVSENSGHIDPDDAPGFPAFWTATLQCDPYYTDWSTYGTVQVYDEIIIPDGLYSVQTIDAICDAAVEVNYSLPWWFATSTWGDMVRNCATTPCGPPDGTVSITTDVTATLDKFRNLPGAPIKARCDLEPAVPDQTVNMADVTSVLDAFRGFGYPFAAPEEPCP